eukprot:507264-Pleurochrysis_carterae.AAC.4
MVLRHRLQVDGIAVGGSLEWRGVRVFNCLLRSCLKAASSAKQTSCSNRALRSQSGTCRCTTYTGISQAGG